MGCSLKRECQQKKNPIFIFKSVRICLQELSVCLGECVNTKFDWEIKEGFEKASMSRAVHLRECLLAGELTVFQNIPRQITTCESLTKIICSILFGGNDLKATETIDRSANYH